MQSSIIKARSSPRNAIKGVIPTVSGFATTTPTNLANTTDGNLNTYATVGTATVSAWGIVGGFIYDMGPNFKPCMVAFSAESSVGTGGMNGYIYTSQDGNTYTKSAAVYSNSATALGNTASSAFVYVPTRYFKVQFESSSATTGNVILHEVVALAFNY